MFDHYFLVNFHIISPAFLSFKFATYKPETILFSIMDNEKAV